MTIDEIKRRLNRLHPDTVEDIFVECGFTLTFVGSGQFRATYKVAGHSLVIKVPFRGDDSYINHANDDYRMYQKVIQSKQKYAFLKPYIPKVLFHNNATGVTVVEQCRTLEWIPKRFKSEVLAIDRFCRTHGIGVMEDGFIDSDLGLDKFDNYGVAKDGSLKILDLGCAGGC